MKVSTYFYAVFMCINFLILFAFVEVNKVYSVLVLPTQPSYQILRHLTDLNKTWCEGYCFGGHRNATSTISNKT